MDIRRAYTNWSATYDSDGNLTRDLDALITRNSLTQGHYASILELACGTGKNTPLLSQIGERVYANDFSEGMIAQARAKLNQGNVSFSISDLTRPWPFASASFDLVACNLVLEHISDLAPIFAEATRVLRASGCFFISELHPFRQYRGAQATFSRDDEATKIPAYVHNISDFLNAAEGAGLALAILKEWWHEEDQHGLPRLVSFTFENALI